VPGTREPRRGRAQGPRQGAAEEPRCGGTGTAPRGRQDARGEGGRGAQGRRKGRERGKREREGELTSGIRNLAITITESPRARGGRERWMRGSCCAGKSNERKEERGGRTWGEGGAPGACRARLGRVAGQKPVAHTTMDRKPIVNQNPSEAKRTSD
jgi:hypothetical protein